MIGKKTPPQLITPEEAVELSKYSDNADISAAVDIFNHWETRYRSPVFDFYCRITTVYIAGRIQGIREERTRRGNFQKSGAAIASPTLTNRELIERQISTEINRIQDLERLKRILGVLRFVK